MEALYKGGTSLAEGGWLHIYAPKELILSPVAADIGVWPSRFTQIVYKPGKPRLCLTIRLYPFSLTHVIIIITAKILKCFC